jgi:hypothetical protein
MKSLHLAWAALAAALASISPVAVHETSMVYEAVLAELKMGRPGQSVILYEKVLAGHCTPHCRDANLVATHPRPWLEHLLATGVIAGTCTPPDDRSIGCIPGHGGIGVSLGEVVFEEGRAETEVILFGPHQGRIIDAEGVRFTLERRQNGQWVVVARRRTWVS